MEVQPSVWPFRHEALFYSNEGEFVDGVTLFIREAIAEKAPVMVAVGERKQRLLGAALGEQREQVRFVDMMALGRNPGRIISAWREFVAERDGRPARGVGEPVWPGRSDPELAECDRHESLLNLAFEGAGGFTLLCPYDAAGLDADVLAAARANHPRVTEGGHSQASSSYIDPRAGRNALSGTLAPAPEDAEELGFGISHLRTIRRLVWERASEAGLPPRRQSDVVLAVNELVTNSIVHGGGGGSLKLWREHGALLCEVADGGSIADPLVGRCRRHQEVSGRGLWIVHQLCDLVQIRSEGGSTRVRVRVDL